MCRIKWVALLPLLCLVAVGCNRKQVKAPPPKDPEVMVALPFYQEVTDYEDFTGRTAATEDVTIRARVSGYLERSYFKEGDDIENGYLFGMNLVPKLLFEIDPRPYQAELDRARASLRQSMARRDRLGRDYERAVGLRAKGSLSPQEFDAVVGDLAESKASVGVAEAAVAKAQLDLDFTKVYAPFDGRISRRIIDPANLVKADDTALTTIVRLDPMYVYFDVDERTMLKVRRLIRDPSKQVKSYRETGGLPVQIGLADETGYPHRAMVNFVDNRIDESTGTLRVRAVLRNPRVGTSYLFSPGQFVRIRFPVGQKHTALLIAERALGTDQGQKFVYVIVKKRNDEGIEEDRVDYRQIRYGAVHKGLRVILDGVKPGERVMVSGLQRVRPNVKVIIKKVDMVSGKPLPWWNAWNYFDWPATSGTGNNNQQTKK